MAVGTVDTIHVHTSALSHQDHLAEEVSVCLQNPFWPFIWYDFALIVENVFSLCFVILSWNFTDGGSSSNLVRLND